MEEDEEVTLRIPQREKAKTSAATFTDEDLDKNLKYKAAEDYLDKIAFPNPSSIKGVTNFKTIEKNVLEPAEEKINHKKTKLKNSAKFINLQGRTYARPLSENPHEKTKKMIEQHNILSDYIYNLNMLIEYKKKKRQWYFTFQQP